LESDDMKGCIALHCEREEQNRREIIFLIGLL